MPQATPDDGDADRSPDQDRAAVRRRRKARAKAAGLGRSRAGIRVPGPIGRPRTRPAAVAADKACSSKANRAYLRRRRIAAVIPEKADQQANRKKKGSAGGRPVGFDPERYKQRNTVERCFLKLKTWRGLATRYGKSPESYEAGVHLRGSIMWVKHLTSAT